MKIVTLTLNPAIDVHCYSKCFKPYHESVATILSKEAGGKGVNISRALSVNGVENLAIVVVGNQNGEAFCRELKKDGMNVAAVYVDGSIRENMTLHEDGRPETRISFEGFSCEPSVLEQVVDLVGAVDENTIVTFTGSVPKGITTSDVLDMLKVFRAKGAKIVIDSRSVTFEELIGFKPWLIKPNKDEAEFYANTDIRFVGDAVKIAWTFSEKGVENVMISLGGDGAVLVEDKNVFVAKAPGVNVCSTIGAGDSMLAGFIFGVAKGLSKETTLKKAVAFGTAACMREGTLPPLSEDINRFESRVNIRTVSVACGEEF